MKIFFIFEKNCQFLEEYCTIYIYPFSDHFLGYPFIEQCGSAIFVYVIA